LIETKPNNWRHCLNNDNKELQRLSQPQRHSWCWLKDTRRGVMKLPKSRAARLRATTRGDLSTDASSCRAASVTDRVCNECVTSL